MARTAIPITEVTPVNGTYKKENLVFTNGDAANGMEFVNDGNVFLYMKNLSGATKTATIFSIADPYNRTGDISVTVNAGSTSYYGPFRQFLFNQTSGKVNVDLPDDTSVGFAVVRVPREY